jgi:hypothetical protein
VYVASGFLSCVTSCLKHSVLEWFLSLLMSKTQSYLPAWLCLCSPYVSYRRGSFQRHRRRRYSSGGRSIGFCKGSLMLYLLKYPNLCLLLCLNPDFAAVPCVNSYVYSSGCSKVRISVFCSFWIRTLLLFLVLILTFTLASLSFLCLPFPFIRLV